MKTVTEIYGEMLKCFTEECGMTLDEGSEMAVRLHAFAAQIYGLYRQNSWTMAQCFPQTASGEYLDYHANLRGMERGDALRAKGMLRFSVEQTQSEALVIPKGTICMSAGLVRFETSKAETLVPGALFVDVSAQAVEEGPSGNVSEGSVRVMAVAPPGIRTCTNPVGFVGGGAKEEDEHLRLRVLESYQRMPNGANAAYYEREARSILQVVAVNVISRARGRGTVDVVVAGAMGDADVELINMVQAHLEKQREIAVDVCVLAATVVPFALSVQLKLRQGAEQETVEQKVETALSAYFSGRRLGESVLRAKLGQLIYEVEGVENYTIVQPAQDLVIQPGQLPKPQTLSVEVLS